MAVEIVSHIDTSVTMVICEFPCSFRSITLILMMRSFIVMQDW
uniref:Uncharacterized protein n=1 Tax=Rhizophora mucronata TaxID=61149 RepID=A0A2P2KGC0_RHIMU